MICIANISEEALEKLRKIERETNEALAAIGEPPWIPSWKLRPEGDPLPTEPFVDVRKPKTSP